VTGTESLDTPDRQPGPHPEVARDASGVPDIVFGRHDEQFYGALGRVACLAALLEEQLRVLLQTLHQTDQAAFARMPVGKVVKEIRAEIKKGPRADREREIVGTYLVSASEALVERNNMLHSLWPAQDDGTWFRHRLDPKGERAAVRTGPDEMLGLIGELVRLVLEWPNIYSIVGIWSRPESTRRTN
jgi:hypothetical protein